jgi:hypothetical protein
MVKISSVDEYKLSTLYTSVALAFRGSYEIYDHGSETQDVVISYIYAAILTLVMAFLKTKKIRFIVNLAVLLAWVARGVIGGLDSGFEDLFSGEQDSIIFWSVNGVGFVSSIVSLIGQWIRRRREVKEHNQVIEPVKLRFMA